MSDKLINGAVQVYRRNMERWLEQGHSEADIRAFVERHGERLAKEACRGLSPLARKIRMKEYRRANERIVAILFPKVPS